MSPAVEFYPLQDAFASQSIEISFGCDPAHTKPAGDILSLQSDITLVIEHPDNFGLLWRYIPDVHESVFTALFRLLFLEIAFQSVKSF